MSFFFSTAKAVEEQKQPIAEVTNESAAGDALMPEKHVSSPEEDENKNTSKDLPVLNLSIDEDDEKLDSAFERALNKESVYGEKASLASPTAKVGLNYDENPTNLYQSIEAREWDEVVDLCARFPSEAAIWIFRNEKTGHKLRWRLLPIHAAIIFRAPDSAIRALLKAFPEGAKCKDDQEMTPLHLAFRHESSDSVLYELLKVDPTVVNYIDRKGRVPLQLHRSAQTTTSAGSGTKKSGIAKLVSIAVTNENKKVTAQLRSEHEIILSTSEKNHNSKFQEAVQYYEDAITTLRKEMSAKIAEMDQSVALTKSEAESKIKELESEMNTARLASESLITRFDNKCKSEEELTAKLAAAQCKLKELEWGQGDTVKEKNEIQAQLEKLNLELEEVLESRQQIAKNLFEVQAERDSLALSLDQVQSKLLEMNSSNAIILEKNYLLSSEVQDRENLIADMKARICLMEESISAKADQIAYLQGNNEALQARRDELTEKVEAILIDLKDKRERLQLLEEVDANNQNITADLLELKAQLKEKEDRLEELHAAEVGVKVTSLKEQAGKLQAENERLQNEVDESRVLLKKYEREVADAKNASNSLIKQFHAKSSSEVQLKSKLAALERTLNSDQPTLQSDNISLRESVEVLEKANSELGEKVQRMEDELAEKAEMVSKFEKEWRIKTEKMKEKEAIQSTEIARSKEKVAILERIISKLQEKIHTQELSNKELRVIGNDSEALYSKQKMSELSKEVESKSALNIELTQRLRLLERKNTELLKSFERTQSDHEAFLASYKKKEEQTVGSLSVRQRMSEALEEQLAASHELNQELQTKIKTLEAKNGALAMKVKSMSHERYVDPYEVRESGYMKAFSIDHREAAESDELMGMSAPQSSLAMRQRMKQSVERQVKEAQDKAFSERKMLLETARKQRQDIESSFANATAAISMLRETGMRSP